MQLNLLGSSRDFGPRSNWPDHRPLYTEVYDLIFQGHHVCFDALYVLMRETRWHLNYVTNFLSSEICENISAPNGYLDFS